MQKAEAVDSFRDAISRDPDFAEAHYNLGVALALLGRDNESLKSLSETIRLSPDHAEGHLNLGLIYARQGHLDEAIRHFSEAIRIKPDFTAAKHYLAKAKKDIRTATSQ